MAITAAQRTASGTSELTTAERNALKKAGWRLLPLLTIAHLFNYFDRTVVGFAALIMNRDIGLTSPSSGEIGSHVLISFANNSRVRVIAANEIWPADAVRRIHKRNQR